MNSVVLGPEQIGERVTAMIEGMKLAGMARGQMAIAGAHVLLEYIPEEFGVAEELLSRLDGSGLEREALQAVNGLEIDDRRLQRLKYRHERNDRNRWSEAEEETDEADDEPKPIRDQVMDPDYLGQKEAGPLYEQFSDIVDGFIAGSPEQASRLASIEGVLDNYGFWGEVFIPTVVDALIEEGHFDAALLASNQAHSVKQVERRLLEMAKGGYKPAVLNAHSRFEAEVIYARRHYYDSDGGGEMQLTGDMFEAALELDMLDVASKMFDAVRDQNQLESMIRHAIPTLVDRNEFSVDQLLADGTTELTKKVLLGIMNNFDLQSILAEPDKAWVEEKAHWSTYSIEESKSSIARSTVLFDLGIELCYRGRVAEAEQIEAARIEERGHNTELQRFIGLGHFIASDIETALTRYKEVEEARPSHRWLQRESIPYLAKRGAVAEALLMACGLYNVDADSQQFGEHSSYLLSLAIAAAHGVYESTKNVFPEWKRKRILADHVIEVST